MVVYVVFMFTLFVFHILKHYYEQTDVYMYSYLLHVLTVDRPLASSNFTALETQS